MSLVRHEKEEFDGIINISSDIRKNKRTLIGKYDVKDLIFIGIAVLAWIILSVIFIILANEDLIPIYAIVLITIIIPIMYVGFKKKIDMPMLDYIMMNRKSNNRAIRTQTNINRKNNHPKTFVSFELVNNGSISDEDLIKIKIRELSEIFDVRATQLVFSDKIFINMSVSLTEDFSIIPIYNYLKRNNNIKARKMDDILKFNETIYSINPNRKIRKYKNNSKVNDINDKNFKSKVYKVKLYNEKINYSYIDELRRFAIVVKYVNDKEYDTFICINGDEEEINEKSKFVLECSKRHYIVIEELFEQKNIYNAVTISMNSRY